MDTNEAQPLEVAAEPAVEQALLPNDSVQPVPLRAWPSKPWLTIWTKPRGTIRAILNSDPRRFVLLLAGLSGIYGSLNNLSSRQLGESTPWYILVLIAFIVGPIGGIIGLYLGGAVFSWVGSLLKGHGDAEQQRAAIAWSFIPSMVSLVLWLPLLALYGGEMVYGAGSRVEASPFLYLAIVAIQLVMALWSFILLVKTTAEVHRFSAWRGLATVLIPGIVIFVLLFACVVAVSSVTITP